MGRIAIGGAETVDAAVSGERAFVGGGAGSAVRPNGNPHDYRLTQRHAGGW